MKTNAGDVEDSLIGSGDSSGEGGRVADEGGRVADEGEDGIARSMPLGRGDTRGVDRGGNTEGSGRREPEDEEDPGAECARNGVDGKAREDWLYQLARRVASEPD